MILPIVVGALCGFYLWVLFAGVLGVGSLGATDRLKLVTLVLETLVMLLLAQVLVPWTPTLGLVWVAGVGAVGAGVVLAVRRGRTLPWFAAASPGRLRLRRLTAPPYAAVLATTSVLGYATVL